MDSEDICIVDCGTTHTILQNRKYFTQITKTEVQVGTISGISNIIEGFGKVSFVLPNDTHIHIPNALYSSKSTRNLLSFKDIRLNNFHIETTFEANREYLLITSANPSNKEILEKFHSLFSGLYMMKIRTIESHNVIASKLIDPKSFTLWHERLGHPGVSMMRRIIENSNGHSLKDFKVLSNNDLPCSACSLGKLITGPFPVKVRLESPTFLERIQGDICGPIHPSSGPFRYFMVLIDASTRWSHICLLSTRNDAFAKLLAQIIKLRAQFPDHCIKSIRLDNAGEFTSATFVDYCMSVGISVEHPVPHVHTQNGLAESFIKRLQLIARPLLLKAKLPTSIWGHAILHAANIIRIRPTSYNQHSPLQLVLGQVPNISHFKIFGSAVYVPIAPPQRSKMGAQRRVGTTTEVDEAAIYLKTEFEMKDLGRTKYCLGIQVEHLSSGIFLHQSTYTEKVLNRFYMDKSHPLTTPMVVRSLEPDKDPFRPREDDLALLRWTDIGMGSSIYFVIFVEQLIFGLFFPKNSTSQLIGYADAGYLSDPHFGKSQTGYVFTYCDAAISWKSTKQTTVATSTNHSELIAIHEASRECVWLRSIIKNIQESCGLPDITRSPTVMFEDNTACIDQLREGYIKGDRTKHISPKFFYTHELQKNGEIDIQQIRSCDNLADLFTKSLPNSTFGKLRHNIGMRRLKDLLQQNFRE
ncbi:uncharacterized protein LOC141711251 [Apium graveolens]|uniref:uncharacterized protein LOC141711251 n=1 Tax=Apium graveolens TaxID=4045 RepID=UPI003D7AD04E